MRKLIKIPIIFGLVILVLVGVGIGYLLLTGIEPYSDGFENHMGEIMEMSEVKKFHTMYSDYKIEFKEHDDHHPSFTFRIEDGSRLVNLNVGYFAGFVLHTVHLCYEYEDKYGNYIIEKIFVENKVKNDCFEN